MPQTFSHLAAVSLAALSIAVGAPAVSFAQTSGAA